MIDLSSRASALAVVIFASIHAATGSAARRDADAPAPAQLANAACPRDFALAGASIRAVKIDNAEIFDLRDPREDIWPYRLANRLHVRTRPRVVEQQLLFRAGDRYDQRVIDESARLLRANAYFHDAKIVPVNCADGKVDVRVNTRDVWTLNPGVSFSRAGGRNTSGIELEDLNLLGTGAALTLSRRNGVDRNSTSLTYADRHLLGSWTALNSVR